MTATTPKINVSQLTLYNPARLTDAEIVAAFVARKAVFERVLADIVAEKPDSRAQHHLIVGQRGMGKSTLLARLASELRTNAEFSKRFVPLVFAEEQYTVDRLSKFWLNCLDALADAAERVGDTAGSDRIDAVVRSLKGQLAGPAEKDEAPAQAALDAFLQAAESSGKRPVLLVDNLQLVFERIAGIQQHTLRELLMRPGSPVLIGASPSPPSETQNYGAAFYDHFKTHYLQALSSDEMRELMLKLAETTGRTDVRDKVLEHSGRLKSLRDLTGGNPRTVVALFFLFAEDFADSVLVDLENLLDRITPLYKARIEELSDQQQVIVSAVADQWAPTTARALSETIGLPMSTISAQLERLEKIGFVEKVEIFGQTSGGCQIAERFFNIWFLMRSASRRQRRAVEFLVRFIESFYEAKDRPPLAQRLMNERDFSVGRYQFAKALAHTLDNCDQEELSRHAELDILRQKRATEAHRKLDEVIDFSTLPAATLAFDELREKLASLVPDNAPVKPEQFAETVLGDRQMFIRGDRGRLAATKGTLGSESITGILESIRATTRTDELRYGEPSVAWFRKRLATGQLRSLSDSDDWNRSFLKAVERNEVRLLVDSMPRGVVRELKEEVCTRIRKLLTPTLDSPASAWNDLGIDLHKLGWLSESEAAYRKAIELDPYDLYPWVNLGNLLRDDLARYTEAEEVFRKAIDIDQNSAPLWNGMGLLFHGHLGRYAEAEEAYRRAIEVNQEFARAWNNLGNLLQDHLSRYAEAEEAYRKAIEIDEKFAWPWNGLGSLFHQLGRYAEAEAAYRKATEIDEEFVWSWRNLGALLQDHLGRYGDAEAAYRKAIEIDPRELGAWNGLGNLYCDHFRRYSEAASAFTKALGIGLDEIARGNLVFLYRDFLGDMHAAKQTFAPLQAKQLYELQDSFHLHEALFAAYDSNWGICSEALAKATDVIGQHFPASTIVDWCRASAVLLHLNFGEELLAFLRERGDDSRLRPWYEALSALHKGDRRYLQNIPVEMRTTAEYYFDQIEKRLSALPEKSRRRPVPKPGKQRRKAGGSTSSFSELTR
jgi:tetratricopeptide (TPR) repeat protein